MRLTRVLCAAVLLGVLAAGAAAELTPRKIVAVLDSTQSSWSSTKRAVSFYDVTDLSGSDVFNQEPLFSIWTGYEISPRQTPPRTANFEDPGAITVNPVNGAVYVLAFDSGTPGTTDEVGDGLGDYDLYRIDYQEILADYVSNSRPKGTMYAPQLGPDAEGFEIDHPDHSGTTVFMADSIYKVGELDRNQGADYFDYDIDFVNPERMVVLDNEKDSSLDEAAQDHSIYAYNRTSTSPGTGNAVETWAASELGLVNLDFDTNGDPVGRSEPEDMQFYSDPVTGTEGVWVAESDGGGDDIGFFEITNWTGTAGNGYKGQNVGSAPYPTTFALDEDPTVDPQTNDGDHDVLKVDADGNLIIGESGYYDTPEHEPKVITREVDSYDDSGLVDFGAWGVVGPMAPTLDDDTAVTDGRFVTYDAGENQIYWFDIDSGSVPDVVCDVYVYDLDTGTMVYEELNAANHYTEGHGIELFLRGDVVTDGVIDADDIDQLFVLVNSTPSDLIKEWYDLTADGDLTGDDVDELVEEILGTAYGDMTLDGSVDGADLSLLAGHWQGTGEGWATGDVTGDGNVDGADLSLLAQNWMFVAASGAPVPEPMTLALLGLGGLAVLRRRSR